MPWAVAPSNLTGNASTERDSHIAGGTRVPLPPACPKEFGSTYSFVHRETAISASKYPFQNHDRKLGSLREYPHAKMPAELPLTVFDIRARRGIHGHRREGCDP